MFFKLHSERKIGFKKLTKADLGLSISHQTHIGLYDKILTYLGDKEIDEKALLIYNGSIDIVDCYFDRIKNPNGTYRSPKIRKGDNNSVSIVTIIRNEAKRYGQTYNWYLVWFGLEHGEMVFYFFNNHSSDFNEVSKIIDLTNENCGGRIDNHSVQFNQLLEYLELKVNKSGESIIAELEIESQIGSEKKYKVFDLEAANTHFQLTGKKGEEEVAKYLEYLKNRKQILEYNWFNKSRKTGLPYDFSLQTKKQNIIYIDVKSTNFKFEQPLIFSNNEIDFICNTVNYNIYRVYNLSTQNGFPKLKICENGMDLAKKINPYIYSLNDSLKKEQVSLQMAKIAINPTNNIFNFKEEIDLKY